MELASNLVWAVTAMLLLGGTGWSIRSGRARLAAVPALTLACLICMMLLPVLSVSDDLLAADQAALPASAQTWRMAWEDASVGLEPLVLLGECLMLLAFVALLPQLLNDCDWDVRPQSAWLARTLRLRPPPVTAY